MTLRFPKLQEHEPFLGLTKGPVIGEIEAVLSQFWLPPHEVAGRVERIVSRVLGDRPVGIVVSGETKNVALYVLDSEAVLSLSPFSSIADNCLSREVYDEASLPQDRTWYVFPRDVQLVQRLCLPRVLLVNPCVLENFPIPRLCLSIGLLASYLRKCQKADVRLIDMQVGPTIEDIRTAT